MPLHQEANLSGTYEFELEARREAVAGLLRVRMISWWTSLALTAMCGAAAVAMLAVLIGK